MKEEGVQGSGWRRCEREQGMEMGVAMVRRGE